MNCYAEEAPDRFPTPAAAHKLALADVVAWWRFELAAMARALRTSADRARDELGIELRSFYRTSPPAADRWVHRARYEVIFLASFFPCPFSAARAAVVRRASTRRLDPAARWPAPGPTAEPTSGPDERNTQQDAIDATRHNKRRQNAATRRSRPSRRR